MDRQNWSSVQSAELPRQISALRLRWKRAAPPKIRVQSSRPDRHFKVAPPCTGVWTPPSLSLRWRSSAHVLRGSDGASACKSKTWTSAPLKDLHQRALMSFLKRICLSGKTDGVKAADCILMAKRNGFSGLLPPLLIFSVLLHK